MFAKLATVLLVAVSLAACGYAAGPSGVPVAAIANPASTHCADVGGRLAIEKTPRGAEYGVCLFEDNRQCEEWALLRGECPVGGRKVTGYATVAARYCAITGGRYDITGNSGADDERGTCTLPSGKICAADRFFDGTCMR